MELRMQRDQREAQLKKEQAEALEERRKAAQDKVD